eukprot:3191045-Rhodomonas_salina.1
MGIELYRLDSSASTDAGVWCYQVECTFYLFTARPQVTSAISLRHRPLRVLSTIYLRPVWYWPMRALGSVRYSPTRMMLPATLLVRAPSSRTHRRTRKQVSQLSPEASICVRACDAMASTGIMNGSDIFVRACVPVRAYMYRIAIPVPVLTRVRDLLTSG